MRVATPRRLVLLGVAVALVVVALLLSWRRVPVDVPAVDPATENSCRALRSALPRSVEGQNRRAARPGSALTAAWGNPAIVLRCGVARPTGLELTSQLVAVDDVDWFAEQRPDGYLFTTVRRVANVEVHVPRAYAPEVNPLTDLAGPIRDRLPVLPR